MPGKLARTRTRAQATPHEGLHKCLLVSRETHGSKPASRGRGRSWRSEQAGAAPVVMSLVSRAHRL